MESQEWERKHCAHGLKGMIFHLDPKTRSNLHALDGSFPPPCLPPPLEWFDLFILYAISANEFQEGSLQQSLRQPVSRREGLCTTMALGEHLRDCLADHELVFIQT